ncbi:limb region 1 homolog-like protein isoform X2 [Halichondria panicea]|uniref:limb region 1 homolog-like protein isoform X2 n=1 Tax=Halichondria panicea TaxID=6063 RepID=UPI00312BBF75
MDLEDQQRQREFYSHVRETIISLLVLLLLYLFSYGLVSRYKRHKSREDCYSGEEDATVYRITTWLCSFSLCVSLGSALLLPMSIVGNEVLVHYPHSYYVQWLNTSLIRGLWNMVFLGSNVSLFLLLPFAYFFTESEGLAGSKKGVMSRITETALLLCLLGVMAALLAGLLSSFLSGEESEWWWSALPLLYSLVSMLGVLVACLVTPLGFSALFTLLGEVITRPMLHGHVEERIDELKFEEAALQRRHRIVNGMVAKQPATVEDSLNKLQAERRSLERRLRSSPWERNLVYPLCFLGMLGLSLLALLLVLANTLSLLLDPTSVHNSVEYLLGYQSTSQLGAVGACVEVVLIVYLMCASVVGVYSTPRLNNLLPKIHDTPMTKVIANCALLLMLSSALPLLSKTLGITRFNLLGLFGSFEWLGNVWLVLGYNCVFFVVTSTILSQRVTRTILKETSKLLGAKLNFTRRKGGHSNSPDKSELHVN